LTTQQPGPSPLDFLKHDSRTNRLFAFGTSYVFQHRVVRLGKCLRLLTYAGLLFPLMVGAVALSFGAKFKLLPIAIVIASTILVVQLAVSLWAIIARWVENHAYATESVTANDELARRYDDIMKSSAPYDQLKAQFDVIRADDQNRRTLDGRQNITEKEKNRGMRAALRNYQQPCATCNIVPISMMPTSCPTCGSF
jgi:mobilome CxxCx(11)CxxC protein